VNKLRHLVVPGPQYDMELRSYHHLCVSLSILIMVSIGLSAAADEIYVRDVSLRNLLCEDADSLGLTVNCVKVHLHNARKKMRVRLAAFVEEK